VPSQQQGHVVAVEFGGPPLPVQAVPDGVDPRGVQGGQRLAAPQPDRLLQQGGRVGVSAGGARLGEQPMEAVQIDGHWVDGQQVACGSPADVDVVGGGQIPPQPRQVAVEHFPGPLRWAIRPDAVHQLLDRHAAVGIHQQRGQHAALPGRSDVQDAVVDVGLDLAEQPERHRHRATPRVEAFGWMAFLSD
jgi:hypothetical protein